MHWKPPLSNNSQKPVLSVCIPTYNRCSLLIELLHSLTASLPEPLKSRTEIVISDNCSTDGTDKILTIQLQNIPNARLIRPSQHLPTAEQNLCFAIENCTGEFVWTLGDDDAVEPFALLSLQDLLLANKHDLMIFNSRSTSSSGLLISRVRVPCRQPFLSIEFLEFIRRTGFWFVVAGFSTTVFRRTTANTEQFKQILRAGRIYSHVIWLISCFAGRAFIFVNRPLVSYRQNPDDVVETGHWEKVAKREGTFPGGLWSVAFLRMIDLLVERRVIDRDYIRDVVDRNLTQRFVFQDELLSQFSRGLRHDEEFGTTTVSLDDVDYFLNWAFTLWPENLIVLALLEEAKKCRKLGVPLRAGLVESLTRIVDDRKARQWFEHFHICDAYGYSLYKFGIQYFGIKSDEKSVLSVYMEYLDPVTLGSKLCVAETESEIIQWAQAQRC